jgi:carboxylesterase type B
MHPHRTIHPRRASGGNFGMQDTREALRWIQRNVENFGGDPQKVTIFGESSGSSMVETHLVAPRSNGLFQQAIMQVSEQHAAVAASLFVANATTTLANTTTTVTNTTTNDTDTTTFTTATFTTTPTTVVTTADHCHSHHQISFDRHTSQCVYFTFIVIEYICLSECRMLSVDQNIE